MYNSSLIFIQTQYIYTRNAYDSSEMSSRTPGRHFVVHVGRDLESDQEIAVENN